MSSNHSRPNQTEERLRFWLDANQLDRERMCQALLALDRRYLEVRPRHPKGGPDQGRDLEARLDDGRVVWAAIGFRNSVSNSAADKRAIAKKFKTDLARALEENPGLKVFVFMSNVTLTTTGQANLVKHAKSLGIEICDIFHGERLRILLDSPEGLGVRFQYLQLSLSEAEQAAFFARWGNQLEQLINRQFTIFDQKLARLEFLHDCNRPLRDLSIDIRLSRSLSPSELGHFRLLLSIVAPGLRDAYSKLELAVRDVPSNSSAMESGGFWVTVVQKKRGRLEPKRQPYTKFSGLLGEEILFLSARGGFSEWTSGLMPAATLGDLDENFLGVFISKNLSSLVAEIRVVANGYILLQAAAEDLTVYEDGDWTNLSPMELNDEEASVPWVRLDIKGGVIRLDFASSTPLRLFPKAEILNDVRDKHQRSGDVQPHAAPGGGRVKRGQRR